MSFESSSRRESRTASRWCLRLGDDPRAVVHVSDRHQGSEVPSMALMQCEDCGRQVSTEAMVCPHCGRPQSAGSRSGAAGLGGRCPYCGAQTVGRVRGLQGPVEVFVAVLGLVLFVVPGIVYYIWQEGRPYCTNCGRRVAKAHLSKGR